MIRLATGEDVDAIVMMAGRFLRQTPYGTHLPTVPHRLRDMACELIAGEASAIGLADVDGHPVGMLALWAFEHPMSGERIASELVWWVDPDHRGSAGVRLLKWADQWARAHGAAVLQMVAPTPRVGAFYEACGFAPIETSYQRRVG